MKIDKFDDYIEGPMDGLFKLFSFFGDIQTPTELKIKEIRNKFFNYVTKYKDNESQFYIDEIKKFQIIADKMIKKLSKLYAMATDSSTNESIINWELHMKIQGKNIIEDIDFNRNQLKRRIKTIEDVINKEIQYVQDEEIMFSDEFEYANNVISWSSDALSNMPEYSKFDYDDIKQFIKDEFGHMILDSYVEIDNDDEDDDEY